MEENKLIVKFDYNKEALTELFKEASEIDTHDIDSVKEATKKLVKARGLIQKQGKAHRDEANAFNKKVLSIEKEYVAIIEPLELEYKKIIAEDKQKAIMEARKELLPIRLKQFEVLGVLVTEDEILKLDDSQYNEFYMNAVKEKEEREEREEQEKIAREKFEKETKERLEREAQEKIEAEKKAKEEEEKRAEQKKKENEEKLKADKKYQDFLSENNFNETTDRVVEKNGIVRIYRLVAEFKK